MPLISLKFCEEKIHKKATMKLSQETGEKMVLEQAQGIRFANATQLWTYGPVTSTDGILILSHAHLHTSENLRKI